MALSYIAKHGYFEQVNRYDDLVDYLSAELFVKMIEQSQSLSSIQQQADLGVCTSATLKRDGDLLRFTIQIASNGPFSNSLPIMEWAIQNSIIRYAKTNQAIQYLRPMYDASILCAELVARIAFKVGKQHLSLKQNEQIDSSSYIIGPNERDKAIQFLTDWCETEVKEYLKICDPYFGIDDLEILKIINTVNPKCRVHILTGKNVQKDMQTPLKGAFMDHWRSKISDQEPPDTEIVVVGTKSGKPPIHDRWWLSNGGGLRLGTSFNSIGMSKLSEISILSSDDSKRLEDEVDEYLIRKKREHQKERLII